MRIRLDPPVPGAYIIFENVDTGEMVCVKTDENGRARAWIREGTYWIHVFKEGYIPYSRLVEVHGDVSLTITLSPTEITFQDALNKLSPSGLDPNDPAWKPTDGWTCIYDLHRIEDARAFAFWDRAQIQPEKHELCIGNVVESEGAIKIPDLEGICRNIKTVYATKLAIAVKVLSIWAGAYGWAPYVEINDGANRYVGALGIYEDAMCLWNGDTEVCTQHIFDWIVYVLDLTAGKHHIFDKNKNIILSQDVQPVATTTLTDYSIEISSESCELLVDWIAIKVAIEAYW